MGDDAAMESGELIAGVIGSPYGDPMGTVKMEGVLQPDSFVSKTPGTVGDHRNT
jgi:hypothetical protein